MSRRNLLLVTSDQQHFRMMGCAGDPYVNTPALDALAAEGTRFELAYCADPVCVPSRYSMMSGYMPHVFDGMEFAAKKNPSLPIVSEWVDTLPMGKIFAEGGYDAVYGGKLHVQNFASYDREAEPHFGFRSLSTDQSEEMADACADFFAQRRPGDRPFLLWASFIQPHNICGFRKRRNAGSGIGETGRERGIPLPPNFAPTAGEPQWMTRFRDGSLGDERTFELGLNRFYGERTGQWPEAEWRLYRAEYRRCVEDLDRHVGILMDGLREARLEDDTVIVFTSDHGDHDGAHRLAMKRSFYDEASRVPMLIRDTSNAREGRVDNAHIVNTGLDLIPTLCDFADLPVPDGLQGRSLKTLTDGKPGADWREFTVSETVGGRMLRSQRFKYCVLFEEESEEMLVDMEADPGECRNLAGDPQYAEILSGHRRLLSQWVEDNADEKGRAYLDRL